MCPQVSTLFIDVCSSDEEVMLFLDGCRAGDSFPSSFITEVNPFSLEPWDAPEDKWYLYNSQDRCYWNQVSILKITQIGYWKFMNHITIFKDNVNYGRKIIWEFYTGQEPTGNRTGWLMYDYHKFHKACQGISCSQDSSSICRVFLSDDRTKNIADNVDGEHIESMLLRIVEQEERSYTSDVMKQSEAGAQDPGHSRSCQDHLTGDSTGDSHAFTEFSKGEYLELNDLFDLESTSSSSDDSTLCSRNSDACFDAEAMLRDLDNESQASDSKREHVLAGGCSRTTSSPGRTSDQWAGSCTLASDSCLRGQPKRTHSGCSESSSNSSSSLNGSGSKSVARIAKLGKKYCCFAPF